ncbi:MAG: ribbon-helix-helix domain-containing protein [Firmicutes bacterium]|jgi:RHH-type rel operon transcriptional repressor/antitoxin RelB|nr:ribbon-helix-helix domain-containing protein [Bacillota bacterium]
MFAVRLPPDIETRLEELARKTGRTKSYYAKKAIADFLEAEEDYLLAVARLEEHHPRIGLDAIERELHLDR